MGTDAGNCKMLNEAANTVSYAVGALGCGGGGGVDDFGGVERGPWRLRVFFGSVFRYVVLLVYVRARVPFRNVLRVASSFAVWDVRCAALCYDVSRSYAVYSLVPCLDLTQRFEDGNDRLGEVG